MTQIMTLTIDGMEVGETASRQYRRGEGKAGRRRVHRRTHTPASVIMPCHFDGVRVNALTDKTCPLTRVTVEQAERGEKRSRTNL
jgi:hypothetical protein